MKKMPFYTCVPKIMIRWCTVPEIWCATDRQNDGKSDIEGWEPHLKIIWSSLTAYLQTIFNAFIMIIGLLEMWLMPHTKKRLFK